MGKKLHMEEEANANRLGLIKYTCAHAHGIGKWEACIKVHNKGPL
jgi:hypothetical protein